MSSCQIFLSCARKEIKQCVCVKGCVTAFPSHLVKTSEVILFAHTGSEKTFSTRFWNAGDTVLIQSNESKPKHRLGVS
jgi:hypothetical protein